MLEALSPRPQHERGRPHSRTDSNHTSHQPLPHMTFRHTEELEAVAPRWLGPSGHLAEAQALGSLISAPGSLN